MKTQKWLSTRGLTLVMSTASAAVLVACGGGGSLSSSAPVLSGVVAVGAPLPSISVVVTDANNVSVSTETGLDGSYEIMDPPGVQLRAPFKLSVKALLGSTEISLDSFALSRQTISNLTPLTNALMALMNDTGAYQSSSLDVGTITPAKIAAATSALSDALAPVMAAANVSAGSFNPVSGGFVANNQGIDSVMDRVTLEPTGNGLVISNRFVVLSEGQAAPARQWLSTHRVSVAPCPGA